MHGRPQGQLLLNRAENLIDRRIDEPHDIAGDRVVELAQLLHRSR
jgi:hypothetical protein